MSFLKPTYRSFFRHLVVWIVITAFLLFIDNEGGKLITQVLVTVILMSGYMFIYYSELFFTFPKFYKKNWIKFVTSIATTLMVYIVLNYFVFYYLIPGLGDKNHYDGVPIYVLVLNSVFLFFFTSVVAFGANQNRLSKENLRTQKLKEKALLIKELGFLKNQFNSHVTFSFLNYCYSYIHKHSEEGAKAIELFSEILRYTLDNKSDEPIPLQKEIDHILNFLQLQKILNKKIYVDFNTLGDINNKYLAPGILMNFVENAFKHGETSPSNPIEIKLEVNDSGIHFYVHNRKKGNKKNVSTGWGNPNTVKQLDLLYKHEYEYSYSNSEDFYSCRVSLTNKNITYA